MQPQPHQPLPVHDTAIQWLAKYQHPQQCRQLLHTHKHQLSQFFKDSNAQWDNIYAINRYSQSRGTLKNLFPTPEIQQNIEAAKFSDGGNLPLHPPKREIGRDELCINDIQLYLSNQAALLRRKMTSEYENLRMFQNSELQNLLKLKAKKVPEFSKLVEDVKVHGIRRPTNLKPTARSTASNSTLAIQSPVTHQISSPTLTHSPVDLPDLNLLKTDPSLSPFVHFFLQLKVVQQNWLVISRIWSRYVSILQRGLMTEEAFAKAILEDAVRTINKNAKFPVEIEFIQMTRERSKGLPESMHMSRIITSVVLEMAEAGDIEFSKKSVNSKGDTFGPGIVFDVMKLEEPSIKKQKRKFHLV